MKFENVCDFRDLLEYCFGLEKRIERQQKQIYQLNEEIGQLVCEIAEQKLDKED